MKSFFKLTPQKRAAQLLEDARMNRLEHAAAAEHHAALAAMYEAREKRLELELASMPAAQPKASKSPVVANNTIEGNQTWHRVA